MNLENCTISDYLEKHVDILVSKEVDLIDSDIAEQIKNLTMPSDEIINRYRFNYTITQTKKGYMAKLYSDYLNAAGSLCYAVLKTQNLNDFSDWDNLETLLDDDEIMRGEFENNIQVYLTTVPHDNCLKGSYDTCYEGAKQWVFNQQQYNGVFGSYDNRDNNDEYEEDYENSEEDQSNDDYEDECSNDSDSNSDSDSDHY